jgi:hypothetical protein
MKNYTAEDAPGFAKHSSSFKNDDRCYEVHFVVGDTYDEVVVECIRHMAHDKTLVDYDVNWSTEGQQYVGVTCRDH